MTALKKIDAIFLDALVDTMECGQVAHVKAALAAMKTFVDTVLLLSRDDCEDLNKVELKKYPKNNKKQLEASAADSMDVGDDEDEADEKASSKKTTKKGRGAKASAADDDAADAAEADRRISKNATGAGIRQPSAREAAAKTRRSRRLAHPAFVSLRFQNRLAIYVRCSGRYRHALRRRSKKYHSSTWQRLRYACSEPCVACQSTRRRRLKGRQGSL